MPFSGRMRPRTKKNNNNLEQFFFLNFQNRMTIKQKYFNVQGRSLLKSVMRNQLMTLRRCRNFSFCRSRHQIRWEILNIAVRLGGGWGET